MPSHSEEVERLRRRVAELEGELTQANAEAAWTRDSYLLRALMDHLPDSIYFKDRDSRFLRINRALADRFGLLDPAEAIGKTDADFFSSDHALQALADEQELLRSGRPIMYKEEKETWADGRVTWVATTKVPLRDEQGRVVGTFGISRDISRRRQIEDELREAKTAAEAASRAKSEFLANMSHEIRTPMNAVIGMTELVLETELTPDQREYLTMVLESGESLLAIINDILDFSKVEAGKLELEKAPFSLRESLGDAMKSLALRAHAQGLELACEVRHDTPDLLLGDTTRLRQVLLNLVGNAIKFTERGEVLVQVRPDVEAASGSAEETVLHFTISDTGVGVAEEKLRSIFAAFEQADSSVTRKYGGTGLGLSISSRLVELMGGRITVESEYGKGSTFEFTARFALADEIASTAAVHCAPSPGTRVLVVDDNPTNRRILNDMLTNWGLRPTLASSAAQALQLIQEAKQADAPFRLVLTDCNMPEQDGFSLAEQVRQHASHGETVIMMLTSGDQPGAIARCEALGVAAYLMKPVKQSELFDAMGLALGLTLEDEELEPTPVAAHLAPLRILLAEDSLVNQKLAIALLERQGHQVIVANNGNEAVAAYLAQPIDVILMDVQMPEMDGLEAARAIRNIEKKTGCHVPVAAMTAHAMQGDRERCLEAGMDAYIAKPVRARTLLETIAKLVGGPSPSVAEEKTVESAIQWKAALDAIGADRSLLHELIEAFQLEAPAQLAGIEQAVARRDAEALQRLAHSLKSSIRFFGANDVSERAERLEQMGREGRFDAAPAVLSVLQAELTELQAALAAGPPE